MHSMVEGSFAQNTASFRKDAFHHAADISQHIRCRDTQHPNTLCPQLGIPLSVLHGTFVTIMRLAVNLDS